MFASPAQLVQTLGLWHVRSQQGARRNALVACTALAERRRELAEVEEFLRLCETKRAPAATLQVGVRRGASEGA